MEKWRNAGRPTSGEIYVAMKNKKRGVKQYVNTCRARHERTRLQRRDSMLRNNENGCFHVPKKQTTCHKLQAGGVTVTNPADLLQVWVSHFDSLSQSQANNHPSVKEQESELPYLEACSRMYEDFTFDTDITIDEVATAVSSQKSGKSGGGGGGGGADNLDPEHLKYGGYALHAWLLRIFTAILCLESIPPSLKLGVIIPLYKGKGRDPLDPNSYRGITLTSVLSKCLEKIVLHRMEIPVKEAGFPHSSQTAYQRSVSCADAIFSTQEALLKFVREGDDAYLCLYDLEKAFDTIEFPTLLSHLNQLKKTSAKPVGHCLPLARSIGAYQGALNPLSERSLFSTFVLPILLYGCENWVLTKSLLSTLEKFQVEIGRRILRLSILISVFSLLSAGRE